MITKQDYFSHNDELFMQNESLEMGAPFPSYCHKFSYDSLNQKILLNYRLNKTFLVTSAILILT